jgi:hypothetical protein
MTLPVTLNSVIYTSYKAVKNRLFCGLGSITPFLCTP